ncbi:hypothetical protein TNCV_4196101 [Trichonephila clavipes]|nr:hypothetical protein TNCV_4196101 [Trichonephila clavipes]
MGKVDSAFHPFSGSINEYQACLGSELRASSQTDHLTDTSAYAPRHPKVTYSERDKVGLDPYGLLHH